MATQKSNEPSNENDKKSSEVALTGKAKRMANLKNFPKGKSGNPAGRRKGQRDYRTLFWIAIERIADAKNMTAEEVEEAIHMAGITKAIKGDFFFYQELNNRIHGKPTDKMDITSGGKTLADLIFAANGKSGRGSKT